MNRSRLIALALAAGAGALWLRRRSRRRTLTGKNVVIAGGSRGLGLELARVCLKKGARVALLGRDPATLEKAAELLGSSDRVTTAECDVADPLDVRAAIAHVAETFGEVDVLIHAAGKITVGPAGAMEVADYQACLDTHLFGAIHLVEAVLPSMRARRDGSIVLIGSIGGKLAVPHLLPYSASKFALAGYGEGLHAELARYGISVTTVHPGLMRTGSPRNADFKGDAHSEYAWFSIADSLPLLTLSAERAARKIIAACEQRRAECVLVPFSRVLLALRALMPELTADLMALVNRALPAGESHAEHKGRDAESKWSRSPLTSLTRAAELRNNQG